MPESIIKRRKMRPNNTITLEKEQKKKDKEPKLSEETTTQPAKKHKSKKKKKKEKKKEKVTSASDSEEVNHRHMEKTGEFMSASDSDETDNEHTKKKRTVPESTLDKEHKRKKHKSKPVVDHQSASDSDETDKEQPLPHFVERGSVERKGTSKKSEKKSKCTKAMLEAETTDQQPEKSTKAKIIEANRISSRRRVKCDPEKSPQVNYRNKLLDTFVPKVKEDDFISDSDSETDSNDDYETKEYPPWQRTLGWNPTPEETPWPKQRRLGYSDKVKLEKRIKKICKRENMTFSQAREIFSSSNRKPHIRFFQKIGKVFPNMSLHILAKICKETYHEKRNTQPWTPEEVEKLKELLKVHGCHTAILCQHLDRSPKNITDFIFQMRNVPTNKAKRWTKEEDQKLASALAAETAKKGSRASFPLLVPYFNGERTQKQIYQRYNLIQHRIQPDGTLVEDRRATPYEELEYLKDLLNQVIEYNLIEESQLDLSRVKGFVKRSFYLKNRANISGFEKMHVKEILQILIDKQHKIIESRIQEGLLQPRE